MNGWILIIFASFGIIIFAHIHDNCPFQLSYHLILIGIICNVMDNHNK